MKKCILMLSMLAMTMCFVACSSDDDEKDPYNGHEYVDLGLPSGIKWATCNIGATTPEVPGGYYAWGETEEKASYSWGTYFDTKDNGETCEKYSLEGKTVLDLKDDVAHVKWGGNWRIPTTEEIDELLDENNCDWTWTTQNGVKGYKVTSKKNGNSIFLPVTGFRAGSSFGRETEGYYMSSSLLSFYHKSAYVLYFNLGTKDRKGNYRYYGQVVRAVCP